MPEEINNPQGETPEQPATPAETASPTTGGETPPWGDDFSPERAWNTIQTLRSEVKELKPIATEYQKLQEAQMTETEKLRTQLEANETELTRYRTEARQRAAQDAVTQAAQGAIKPEAIWRMVRADIDYDDDGNATNVADLVAGIKADMPELFRSPNGSADGGAGGKAGSGHDINSLIRDMARNAN